MKRTYTRVEIYIILLIKQLPKKVILFINFRITVLYIYDMHVKCKKKF
jgi:hypothetical protein